MDVTKKVRKFEELSDNEKKRAKLKYSNILELNCEDDTKFYLSEEKTRLEDTFGVNMLAICNGKPETLGIKAILQANVDFQFETATRKYKTLLQKEKEKREIQEGLIRACEIIDLIIESFLWFDDL